MEEMVNHFASQFVPTEEEQQVLVVEGGNVGLLRTTKFVLVGKVLTKKPFNKEAFKRYGDTMETKGTGGDCDLGGLFIHVCFLLTTRQSENSRRGSLGLQPLFAGD